MHQMPDYDVTCEYPRADFPIFRPITFGGVKIVALCDGHFPLTAHEVLCTGGGGLDGLLADADLPPVIASHVNAFLIDDGGRVILIDAGAGDLQDPTLGQLHAALGAAGYAPSDVDIVLLTHLHADHAGGLCLGGYPVFPKATVCVARNEAAFWLSDEPTRGAYLDASVRGTFMHARSMLAPYQAEGRFELFSPGASWGGTVVEEAMPGHTPGHTGFRLKTREGDLVFCGDLFHVVGVQANSPGVTVCYDSDPAQAALARADFFKQAARSGDLMAAAHASFPGFGRIEKAATGFRWTGLLSGT